MMSKKPIVILGGGSTGLAAAYRLSQLGKKSIIIEKEKFLGGLSVTLKKDDFFYEFGPHAFHLKDEKITAWIKKLIGEANFRVIPTDTQVLIDHQFLTYPLKADELLKKINPVLGAHILFSYLWARLKNFFVPKIPQNFEDWGLASFGQVLYKISFGDYTAKVWGMSPKKISSTMASQKLAKLNLGDIILKLLGFRGRLQPAYFKTFLYPKEGMGLIFEKMVREIKKNTQIILEAKIHRLQVEKGRVELIEYFDQAGQKKVLPCQGVISTITLKDLVPMFNMPLGKEIIQAAKRLLYRDMVIIYLIVKAENLSGSQWIYLVENQFFFNRVTLAQNLSPDFGPKGKTAMSFEVCCQAGDELWQKDQKAWEKLVRKELKNLGWSKLKIEDLWVEKISNAYPIFPVGFERDLKIVLKGIEKVENLISTGRNGLFLNSDIHDCFKMGFESAEKVLERNG